MTFDPSSAWHWLYCLVALTASFVYGRYACRIFEVDDKAKHWSWHAHQFWFNFLGSTIGWVAAWAVIGSVLSCGQGRCSDTISFSSVVLFFLAFLGITGHLPVSLVGLIGSLKELVTKLLSSVGGKN